MATNAMTIGVGDDVSLGTAPSLRINRRIESAEIPQFFRQCIIDATQWEVNGTRYDQWRAENGNRKYSDAEWRDQVVIPYLQRHFEGLEVDNDNRLYGVRGNVKEKIDERFYDPRQLQGSILARCPGQGWQFALGCCRRMHPRCASSGAGTNGGLSNA